MSLTPAIIKKKAAHRAASDYCQSGSSQWRPLLEPLPLLLFRPEEPDQPLPLDEPLEDELLPLLPELRPLGLLVPCSDWPIFLPNSRLLPSPMCPCRSDTLRFTLPADVEVELSLLILSRLRLSITTSLSIG
jgi:hypothetical protein